MHKIYLFISFWTSEVFWAIITVIIVEVLRVISFKKPYPPPSNVAHLGYQKHLCMCVDA